MSYVIANRRNICGLCQMDIHACCGQCHLKHHSLQALTVQFSTCSKILSLKWRSNVVGQGEKWWWKSCSFVVLQTFHLQSSWHSTCRVGNLKTRESLLEIISSVLFKEFLTQEQELEDAGQPLYLQQKVRFSWIILNQMAYRLNDATFQKRYSSVDKCRRKRLPSWSSQCGLCPSMLWKKTTFQDDLSYGRKTKGYLPIVPSTARLGRL